MPNRSFSTRIRPHDWVAHIPPYSDRRWDVVRELFATSFGSECILAKRPVRFEDVTGRVVDETKYDKLFKPCVSYPSFDTCMLQTKTAEEMATVLLYDIGALREVDVTNSEYFQNATRDWTATINGMSGVNDDPLDADIVVRDCKNGCGHACGRFCPTSILTNNIS